MEYSPESTPNLEQVEEALRARFCSIFDHYDVEPERVNGSFEEISAEYQAEHRVYHTLEHVDRLLTFLEGRRKNIKDWDSVRLAAWFHDVVYDPKAHNNEEKSAEFARRSLEQFGLPEDVISHTEALIRATARHEIIENDSDSAIFLDGDLATLGVSQEDFDKYAARIRQEYSWISEEEYRAGRKKVLENFLKRGHIYHTESTRNELEEQARKNIKRHIEQLS